MMGGPGCYDQYGDVITYNASQSTSEASDISSIKRMLCVGMVAVKSAKFTKQHVYCECKRVSIHFCEYNMYVCRKQHVFADKTYIEGRWLNQTCK